VDAAYPFPVHLTTMNLVGSRTGQWGAGLPYARCCLLFVLDHSCLDESVHVVCEVLPREMDDPVGWTWAQGSCL